MGLLAGNSAARVVGVVLAVISAILALAFAKADPAWAAIVILIDVLVIYALVVHGRELRGALTGVLGCETRPGTYPAQAGTSRLRRRAGRAGPASPEEG